MKPGEWLNRVVLLLAVCLALYLLFSRRLGWVGTALALSLSAIMCFGAMKTNAVDRRAQRLTGTLPPPFLKTLLPGFLCYVGATVWAAAVTFAMERHWLPKNDWTTYGLVGVPFTGLVALGILLTGNAIFRAHPRDRR